MSTSDNGGPAFPELKALVLQSNGATQNAISAGGMTLRDYFAAHAPITIADANDAFYCMHGRNARRSETLVALAEMRGLYADAMLAERDK